MPVLNPTDLKTHAYSEVINEITRGDDTIITTAIDAATQEAKMYLARFDLLQLFGDATTSPTFTDGYLNSLLKDIALWHLMRLANPAIDTAMARKAYEDAIIALKNIMEGVVQPAGWPYAPGNSETTLPDNGAIEWTSIPKRNNYY